MKHVQNKCRRSLSSSASMALLLGLTLTGLVLAKVEPREDAPSTAELMQRMDSGLPVGHVEIQRKSSLRCWQEGTLLFEEVNIEQAALSRSEKVMVFQKSAGLQSGEIMVIETGTALCLFKKH